MLAKDAGSSPVNWLLHKLRFQTPGQIPISRGIFPVSKLCDSSMFANGVQLENKEGGSVPIKWFSLRVSTVRLGRAARNLGNEPRRLLLSSRRECRCRREENSGGIMPWKWFSSRMRYRSPLRFEMMGDSAPVSPLRDRLSCTTLWRCLSHRTPVKLQTSPPSI